MPASDQLKSDIDELVPGMVALRRDLHAHPELAYEEVRTSGIVAQRLHSLGLQKKVKVRPGLSVVFARKDTMCEIPVKIL
jgi:metal-dependent amidase/aminoacylase/carboxypeptidase family protein